MQLGIFKRQNDDTFQGVFLSLSCHRELIFRKAEKPAKKLLPDYKIYRDSNIIGVGYLLQDLVPNLRGHLMSVKIDDPTFEKAIYCYLVGVGQDDKFVLDWDRSNVIPFKQNLSKAS